MRSTSSQTTSRASLWVVPGSGAENASSQSSAVRRTSAHSVVTTRGVVGGSGGVALEAVRGEDLVPVVGDAAEGPAVAAPARQAHRVAVGRAEERLGRG